MTNRVLYVVCLFLFLLPVSAFCYIDPGTGSYIIQVVAAVAFGGILALRIFWGKLKALFGKGKAGSEVDPDEIE